MSRQQSCGHGACPNGAGLLRCAACGALSCVSSVWVDSILAGSRAGLVGAIGMGHAERLPGRRVRLASSAIVGWVGLLGCEGVERAARLRAESCAASAFAARS